jgi:hypothetical protein
MPESPESVVPYSFLHENASAALPPPPAPVGLVRLSQLARVLFESQMRRLPRPWTLPSLVGSPFTVHPSYQLGLHRQNLGLYRQCGFFYLSRINLLADLSSGLYRHTLIRTYK